MKLATLGVVLSLITAHSLGAQDPEHHQSGYAHSQSAEVPSLTTDEVTELRAGQGMALARPAELSHFPGPRHTLDHAADIRLEGAQGRRIEEILTEMTRSAVALGERIIQAEGDLFELFQGGAPSVERISTMVAHIAELRGGLRTVHLRAHLQTRAVLTPEQVRTYDRLRGYGGEGHQ